MASETKKKAGGKRTLILLILCGFLGLSCPICILGTRMLKPSEQKKEIRTAEKLLEEGKVVEAEKKFKELGEYGKHKKDIEAKKKEKHAEHLRKANKAYGEKDFELAVKLYGETRELGQLDEATEAKYKRAEVLLLKEDLPKYLYEARGYFEGVNYDIALEEANKAIEGCDTLEEKAPDLAKEINTERIRKEALVLKDKIEAEKDKAEREAAMAKDPSRFITIKNSWYLGGFGTVAIHKITVKNDCSFPIKNIALGMTYYAGGGDKCDYAQYTIMDKVPANSKRIFREINVGFVNSQAKTCSVELFGVERY